MNIFLIAVLVCIVFYVGKKVFRKRVWGSTDVPASSSEFHTNSDPGDETDRFI